VKHYSGYRVLKSRKSRNQSRFYAWKEYMDSKIDCQDQVHEVVLLYCQNCLNEKAKDSAWSLQAQGLSVRAIMMPCSSKVEVPYILKILEAGADAVEIIACPEESCKFLIGSLRAEKRIEYIRGLLEKIGYARERVGISRKLSQSPEKLLDIARARAEAVRKLDVNPMKGE
jgi:F420-non-reducing hydrogenase iron-sulfur subunit